MYRISIRFQHTQSCSKFSPFVTSTFALIHIHCFIDFYVGDHDIVLRLQSLPTLIRYLNIFFKTDIIIKLLHHINEGNKCCITILYS